MEKFVGIGWWERCVQFIFSYFDKLWPVLSLLRWTKAPNNFLWLLVFNWTVLFNFCSYLASIWRRMSLVLILSKISGLSVSSYFWAIKIIIFLAFYKFHLKLVNYLIFGHYLLSCLWQFLLNNLHLVSGFLFERPFIL